MKEVNIFIRGICKNTGAYLESNEGSYIAVLEFRDAPLKTIVGRCKDTTANRMLLAALIESIKILKQPYIINLYTPTNLGFKSSPNKDLLTQALDLVQVNGHQLNEKVDRKNQNYLIKELKRFNKQYN